MNGKITFLLALLYLTFLNITTAQFIEKTIVHDGEMREYTIYLPSSYDGSTDVPLLFNFHGGSGNIASQIAISDMSEIADTANFIAVYPQALPDPNAGGSTIWTHKEPTDVDDVFFVEAMMDELVADYSIDEDRVYACGYSNGGEFSFELACRLSNRIAAIGVVARSMYIETFDACTPTHPLGVVTIHGSEDDYDGIAFGGITYYVSLDEVNDYWSDFNNTDDEPVVTQLPNSNSSDGSTVEHFSWDNGDGCVSVSHFKVNGGGHDWPGSFGNMDIDATLEIWNFVSQYDLSGRINCNATSTNELTTREHPITIFPNPVAETTTIDANFSTVQSYQIYSTTGTLVQVGNIQADSPMIDVSNLAANIYFLKIGNQMLKLIKKH